MLKSFEIRINEKNGKATIAQNAFAHFCTRERLVALVNEANGKIAYDKNNFVKATVDTEKIAKSIVRKVERELATARKNKATEEKSTENAKTTSRTNKNAPAPAKGNKKAPYEEGKTYTFTNGKFVPTTPAEAPAKKTAPTRAKGGFDFGKIKGKTNAEKNKALHAYLVGMGMKDSRAKDYQAIWTNRPWAK